MLKEYLVKARARLTFSYKAISSDDINEDVGEFKMFLMIKFDVEDNFFQDVFLLILF
jgi:hypothetical protein